MKNNVEIMPLKGFGMIKFGASQKEVEDMLGSPQETESIDVEGEIHEVEVWNYWDQGHAVYFEKDQDNVCTNIETDNEQSILFGEKVFKMTGEAIVSLMKKNGYETFEVEDDDEMEERIVFFDDAHMQFVFDDKQLILVSWAVATDEQGNILWP